MTTTTASTTKQQRDNTDDNNKEVVVVGRTYTNDWKKILEEHPCVGRRIDPILYTPRNGHDKSFNRKISNEELKVLINENGDIQFHRVHEWVLPKLGNESYWEYISV